MTADQVRLALAIDLAILVTLAGLFRRGLHARCRIFTAYLLAVCVGDLLAIFLPASFGTMSSWYIRQAIYSILRTGTALELGWVVLRAFPGARDPWRAITIVILGVMTWAGLTAGPYVEWTLRLSTGTVWLLALVAILVMFGNIPVNRWDRDLAVGFGGYSVTFAILLQIYGKNDWRFAWLQTLQPLAYFGLTVWWAFASWRKLETYPGVSPGVLRRLRLEEA